MAIIRTITALLWYVLFTLIVMYFATNFMYAKAQTLDTHNSAQYYSVASSHTLDRSYPRHEDGKTPLKVLQDKKQNLKISKNPVSKTHDYLQILSDKLQGLNHTQTLDLLTAKDHLINLQALRHEFFIKSQSDNNLEKHQKSFDSLLSKIDNSIVKTCLKIPSTDEIKEILKDDYDVLSPLISEEKSRVLATEIAQNDATVHRENDLLTQDKTKLELNNLRIELGLDEDYFGMSQSEQQNLIVIATLKAFAPCAAQLLKGKKLNDKYRHLCATRFLPVTQKITNVSDEEMLKQGGRESFIKSLMPTVDKHAIEYVNTMHNLENALKTGKIKQLTDEQKVWYEIAKEQSQKYM